MSAGSTSTLRLTQYKAMSGRINGRVMIGRWTDASSSGDFRLEFSPDGWRFAGTRGRSVDSNTSGGPSGSGNR